MSWSLSTEIDNTNKESLQMGLDKLATVDRGNIGNAIPERDTQIDECVILVQELVCSPIFENAETIGVVLSGHANPEHKAQSGWANDGVTVQVFVKKYRE